MTQPHLEKIFYHYIRQNPYLFEIVDNRFFSNKTLQECYKIDQKWYIRYIQIPSQANLIEALKQQKSEISEDEIKIVFTVQLDEYDDIWLKETAESWIELKNLNLSFYDAASLVKGVEINSDNIKSIISSVKDIFLTRNSIDFSFNSGLDFFNPDAHFQQDSNTFSTGYPFLDVCMSGGFELGGLIFLIGRTKIGKSIWGCNLAANSVQNGHNTLYLTLEMSDKKIVKRIGSNLLNIHINEYDNTSKNTSLIKERISDIGSLCLKQPGKLFVKQWPASSAGVPDIENYIKKLQDTTGVKYPIVIVDYINLMKNWRNPNTENTFIDRKSVV